MDVLCQAKSGMGKTAVFVLATLQQLEPVTGQVCLGKVLWKTFWLGIFEKGVLPQPQAAIRATGVCCKDDLGYLFLMAMWDIA